MFQNQCHAKTAPSDARDLIVRVLSISRVARWCEVSDAAVSKWLARGDATAPVPVAHVPTIAREAVAWGKDFDVGLLWPAMEGWKASELIARSGADDTGPPCLRPTEDVQ